MENGGRVQEADVGRRPAVGVGDGGRSRDGPGSARETRNPKDGLQGAGQRRDDGQVEAWMMRSCQESTPETWRFLTSRNTKTAKRKRILSRRDAEVTENGGWDLCVASLIRRRHPPSPRLRRTWGYGGQGGRCHTGSRDEGRSGASLSRVRS